MKNILESLNPLMLSIQTLLCVIIIVIFMYQLFLIFNHNNKLLKITLRKVKCIKSIGLFTLIITVFWELITYFHAFSILAKANGNISPSIVYPALKISLFSILYGLSIYVISIVLWIIITTILEKWLFRIVLCHLYRSVCASDFGSNCASLGYFPERIGKVSRFKLCQFC